MRMRRAVIGQLLVTGTIRLIWTSLPIVVVFFYACHVLLIMHQSAAIPPEEAPLIQ